ncbi:10803_t:CDS:1, partial [Entrophospora sp. SA101]
ILDIWGEGIQHTYHSMFEEVYIPGVVHHRELFSQQYMVA